MFLDLAFRLSLVCSLQLTFLATTTIHFKSLSYVLSLYAYWIFTYLFPLQRTLCSELYHYVLYHDTPCVTFLRIFSIFLHYVVLYLIELCSTASP